MKKLLTGLVAGVLAVATLFTLTACGKKDKEIKVYTSYDLTSESYAFAVKKGNSTVLDAANEVLDEIKNNGQLEQIINSFFDGTSTFTYQNPVATLPTDHETYFIVATNAYFPPFEYYEGVKFSGVDMQIATLIATKLNKTLYILDEEFDSLIPSVQNGEADIAMAGMTVNETRKQQVDFTAEYYESAQVIMTLAKDPLFKDCKSGEEIIEILEKQNSSYKVGTQKATTGYMFSKGDEDFGYDGFKNLTTLDYTNGVLAAKDLQNGKINAVIIDKQPAIMIAKKLNG